MTKFKLYQAKILQLDFQIQSCSRSSSGRNFHFRLDVAGTPEMLTGTLTSNSYIQFTLNRHVYSSQSQTTRIDMLISTKKSLAFYYLPNALAALDRLYK